MSRNWLFAVVGLGAISALAIAADRGRRGGRFDEAPDELGRWEAEGGNVPQVPTVKPALSPQSSVPPHMRH